MHEAAPEFQYEMRLLPRGRFTFRRWRYELWHGARLIAAGWRVQRPDAAQALRTHGTDFAHHLFGLRPPPRVKTPAQDMLPGMRTRVEAHGVSFVLVPRNLEPARATA